jgi:hypothetical protein
MSPRAITTMPHSQEINWNTSIAPDGQRMHTAPVTQRPLQDALNGNPPIAGLLGGLQSLARNVVSADQRRIQVSDHAVEKMKQLEPLQQRVSQLVPHRSNNIFSNVASYGESFVRHEMRQKSEVRPPQYSAQAARETLRSGTGVCTDTNNVLFRAAIAEEDSQLRASMRDRSAGKNSSVREPRPMSFVLNGDPHGFVVWGDLRDPRQAPDVLVSDSWETIPIIKTWSNTQYKAQPYTVKMQTVAGSDSIEGISVHEMAQIAAGSPQKTFEVDAYLDADGRPSVGPALIENVYDTCKRYGIPLHETVSSAERLDLTYQNASTGEVFTPSIASHDFQRYRMATSNLATLQKFRELVNEPNDS